MSRTKATSLGLGKEVDEAVKKIDAFESQVQELTLDRMNKAPLQDVEPQTKLSSKDLEKSKDIYLKPITMISDRQKFNEKFQAEWEHAKEYVQFIAEHKELIGETIETWTHPFGGKGAQYWKVPTNKPVWGPRYLAEQIRRKCYHRLIMQPTVIDNSGVGQFYGSMAVDTTIARLTAEPVSTKKSIFMGAASGF